MKIYIHTYILNTKTFLGDLGKRKYWSPDFQFQNQNVNLRDIFEGGKLRNLFGIAGQGLLVILSIYITKITYDERGVYTIPFEKFQIWTNVKPVAERLQSWAQ